MMQSRDDGPPCQWDKLCCLKYTSIGLDSNQLFRKVDNSQFGAVEEFTKLLGLANRGEDNTDFAAIRTS